MIDFYRPLCSIMWHHLSLSHSSSHSNNLFKTDHPPVKVDCTYRLPGSVTAECSPWTKHCNIRPHTQLFSTCISSELILREERYPARIYPPISIMSTSLFSCIMWAIAMAISKTRYDRLASPKSSNASIVNTSSPPFLDVDALLVSMFCVFISPWMTPARYTE